MSSVRTFLRSIDYKTYDELMDEECPYYHDSLEAIHWELNKHSFYSPETLIMEAVVEYVRVLNELYEEFRDLEAKASIESGMEQSSKFEEQFLIKGTNLKHPNAKFKYLDSKMNEISTFGGDSDGKPKAGYERLYELYYQDLEVVKDDLRDALYYGKHSRSITSELPYLLELSSKFYQNARDNADIYYNEMKRQSKQTSLARYYEKCKDDIVKYSSVIEILYGLNLKYNS